MLLLGDCIDELKKIQIGTVDLVYLDPPFFTQRQHSLKTRDNLQQYSFADTWEDIQQYEKYIQARLCECRRVLKKSGSIFLHCDRTASHYLRFALDNVFGSASFRSEIIWSYKRWTNAKKGLLNSHQTIFFYSKSDDFKFNFSYDAYSLTTNVDQIFQKRARDGNGKTKYKRGAGGGLELIEGKRGVPLSDVWEIPYLNPKANERVGYPTQKPILLLERIIKLVTDADDLVLDPFCGSGTSLVSAKLLKRRYIGIDNSEEAIALTRERLKNPFKSDSALLKNGEKAYLNQSPEILEILNSIDALPVQRNKGIDGFLKIGNVVRPIPIKIQRVDETLEKAEDLLIKASSRNGFKTKILVKTNNNTDSLLFNLPRPEPRKDLIIVTDIHSFAQNKESLCGEIEDLQAVR